MQKQLHLNKLIILLPVLFLLQLSANAQKFRAGISAGLVATDVYGSDVYDNDNDFHKAGFVFGGAVSTALNEKFTLRFELNYIQKGTQQPADSTGFGFYKFSFNYFEFPLLLKYRIRFNVNQKPTRGFDLHAGISVGKLIGNVAEGDLFYSSDDSYINSTDVSLLAGLDYNFSQHFAFCLRYSNSIIPVFKRNPTLPGLELSTYNNGNNMVIHFILQYTFGSVKGSPPPAIENNQQ